MNIKQAEAMTGVSKRNIRFYEERGLLRPTRNQENDYREYSQADIDQLKLIRALRTVDMPMEHIQDVLTGKITLQDAASKQRQRLIAQAEKLETAIHFCQEFAAEPELNVDDILRRMEAPENKKGLFTQWVEDYRHYAQVHEKMVFTFVPESSVTSPAEFTQALQQYAQENGLELTITKQSMYPEFTLNGVEYTASRFYTVVSRFPVAVIRCEAVHLEKLEPAHSKWKQLALWLLHYGWALALLVILAVVSILQAYRHGLFSAWEGWLVILASMLLVGVRIFRFNLLHRNDKHS